MKTRLTVAFSLSLIFCGAATACNQKKGGCGEKMYGGKILDTELQGIAFTNIGGQPVVLVERLERTEIIKASTKQPDAEIIRISKTPVKTNRYKKRKIDFGQNQSGNNGFVGGQTEDSIFVIKPAGDKAVLVCGETQNPCVVDEGQSGTHGSCGADFGSPDDASGNDEFLPAPEDQESLEDYYSDHEDDIREVCENVDSGGSA